MKKNVSVIFIIIASTILIGIVGFTFAYFVGYSQYENTFDASTYSVLASEYFVSPDNWEPGQTVPKAISVTNNGSGYIKVRICLEESWTSNGNTLPLTQNGERIAIINESSTDLWTKEGDCYYYNYELAPATQALTPISGVTFNPNYDGEIQTTTSNNGQTRTHETDTSSYSNATYTLKLTAEGAQASKYAQIWNLDHLPGRPAPLYCTTNDTISQGYQYEQGMYIYRYKQKYQEVTSGNYSWVNVDDDAWGIIYNSADAPEYDDVTGTYYWQNTDENITSCSFIDNKPVKYASYAFSNSTNNINMNLIDLSKTNTTNITDMSYMFNSTVGTNVTLNGLDTRNVTDMSYMFSESNYNYLDLTSFDTRNVTNMSGMFENTSISYSLNLSSFELNSSLDTTDMFDGASILYGYAKTTAYAIRLNDLYGSNVFDLTPSE